MHDSYLCYLFWKPSKSAPAQVQGQAITCASESMDGYSSATMIR